MWGWPTLTPLEPSSGEIQAGPAFPPDQQGKALGEKGPAGASSVGVLATLGEQGSVLAWSTGVVRIWGTQSRGRWGRRKKGLLIRELTAGREQFGIPQAPTLPAAGQANRSRGIVVSPILQAGKLRLKVTGSR